MGLSTVPGEIYDITLINILRTQYNIVHSVCVCVCVCVLSLKHLLFLCLLGVVVVSAPPPGVVCVCVSAVTCYKSAALL